MNLCYKQNVLFQFYLIQVFNFCSFSPGSWLIVLIKGWKSSLPSVTCTGVETETCEVCEIWESRLGWWGSYPLSTMDIRISGSRMLVVLKKIHLKKIFNTCVVYNTHFVVDKL